MPGKKGGGKKGGNKGGGPGGQFSLKRLFGLGMDLAHPTQQAHRDMSLIYGPQVRGLKHDYRNYSGQMGALYEILGNQMAPLAKQAAGDFNNVNQGYTQGTEGIINALGQSTAPDAAAFKNMLGSQAIAGSRMLGTMGAEDARTSQSMQQQGGLESMILQRNARGDLQDALNEIRKQRGTDFRSRLDELRGTSFERLLALQELKLRAAAVGSQLKGDKNLRNLYSGIFGGALGVGGGGGGTGSGGGGTGGGGGTYHPKPPKRYGNKGVNAHGGYHPRP